MLSSKAATSGRLRHAIPIVLPTDHGKRQRSAAAVPLLPDNALVEIFSRVPTKSLCRFKCVSRAWRDDLIADRLCCKKVPQTLKGFFVNTHQPGVDHDGDSSDVFINTFGRYMPLASYTFLWNQPGIEDCFPLDSYNGLLLFEHRRYGDTCPSLGYIVCNPAIEQWVAVPPSNCGYDWNPEIYDDDGVITFLIFNPVVSSHFQLVEFITFDGATVEEVNAYSSETGKWCEGDWSSSYLISFIVESAFVNVTLHLSAFHLHNGTRQDLILAVDGEGKFCRCISGPVNVLDVVFVDESQGLVHCVSQHKDNTRQMNELSIWVLQDYDAEEWVLKHRVEFFKLFGRTNCGVEFEYTVAAMHPDRNLIFFFQDWDQKLKSYDMDSKEVYILSTFGVVPQYIFPLVPYYAEILALSRGGPSVYFPSVPYYADTLALSNKHSMVRVEVFPSSIPNYWSILMFQGCFGNRVAVLNDF